MSAPEGGGESEEMVGDGRGGGKKKGTMLVEDGCLALEQNWVVGGAGA